MTTDIEKAAIEDQVEKIRQALLSGEPIFVLYGRDILAARTVGYWSDLALNKGVNANKVNGARTISSLMSDWPIKKFPD